MDNPKIILDEITPYLTAWDLDVESIELASHSENIVYKLTATGGEKYALRVHRPGYHSLDELSAEQVWTDALRHHGVAVPQALACKNGDYYVAVECGSKTRQMGLIGWLEGKPLSSFLPVREKAGFPLTMAHEMGVICARLHNQAANWQPPTGFTRHDLNLDGFVGEQPFWGRFWEAPSLTAVERRTLAGLRVYVAAQLELYGQQPETFSMIHADLHEHNLFVTDAGLVVIDFDDAGFGWHVYDLAVTLGEHVDRPDFDEIKYVLIKGYRTMRDIPDSDLELLPLFFLIRTLASIGWASARPELGNDDYVPYLIQKACAYQI